MNVGSINIRKVFALPLDSFKVEKIEDYHNNDYKKVYQWLLLHHGVGGGFIGVES